MPAITCPSDAELARFARNALRQPQMDEVAAHVVRCSECEQKLALVAHTPTSAETIVPVHPAGAVAASGGLLGERYVLHERLGAGGMGYVYRAEQVAPVRREVAVKVMRPGLDSDEFLARFEGERQAVARMDHPNIARVYDAGSTTDDRPYLALELVNGPPVTHWCDAARLGTRERVALMVPVCRAVQHAHLKGVIHRDLKPSNILVAEVDGRPVPKVIDFGIAKASGLGVGGHTRLGVVIGTPEYMSPEQAGLTGADVDTRSDVYALGVVLYELLTGSTPFPSTADGGSVWEVLRRIREEDPPAPTTKLNNPDMAGRLANARGCTPERLRRELGGELRWVVMRALERDRERRYQSANALADDLERYLRDEPLDAGPPTATYRLRKFVSRNRSGVIAGGAVLAALVAAVAGTTTGMVRSLWAEEQTRSALVAEGQARRDEETARQDAERLAGQARQEKEAAERARGTAEDAKTAAERATGEAERARLAAEQAQKQTDAAQKRTRGALFSVTDFATGGPFGRGAQVGPAEQEFLAGILDQLQRFDADGADGLPADVRGECLFRIALLQLRLGLEGPSEKTFREAKTIWEKLLVETPNARLPRYELSRVCSELAGLALRKNPAAAAKLYDQAVEAADSLAKDEPTAVHQVQLAKVRRIRAEYYHRSGNTPKAIEEMATVVEVLRKLAEDDPNDKLRTFELAAALDLFAGLTELTRDGRKADALWAESLKWHEKLSAAYPKDVNIIQSMSRVLMATGRRTGGPAGVALYRKALAMRKQLMTDYPSFPQFRMDYAATATNLAANLTASRDLAAAEPLVADALAIRTRMVKEFPNYAMHKVLLAHTLGLSGQIARLKGNLDAAVDLLDQAMNSIDPVVADDPRGSLGREIHSMCHGERALLREKRKEFATAADDWAAMAKSAGDPGEPTARNALALAKAGKTSAAASQADALRKPYSRSWRVQFILARTYAVLSTAEPTAGHADTVAVCLGAAIDAGLPDLPDRKWEPDLDPVRNHKEVAAALARLRAAEELTRPRPAER